MSWFTRRPCTYVPPRNPDWTPAEGERIERYYRPLIAAHEAAHDSLRQDFTPAQWHRYQVWIRFLDSGMSLRHLRYAVWLTTTGRIGQGDDHAD